MPPLGNYSQQQQQPGQQAGGPQQPPQQPPPANQPLARSGDGGLARNVMAALAARRLTT